MYQNLLLQSVSKFWNEAFLKFSLIETKGRVKKTVKKRSEKVPKSGRHFWAIWGNCGPCWVIFGPLWIILGHSRAILGHYGPFEVIFGPLWAIWVILGHFWAIFGPFLVHFWAICSHDSRETLKYGTFGRKKFGFRAMSRRILKLCMASLLNILCFPAAS